jgi:hypothetical protein
VANYVECGRTNYFLVKDPAAFLQAMEGIPNVEVITKVALNEDGSEDNSTLTYYGLIADNGESGFPTDMWSEEDKDYVSIDLPAMVANHLLENEVAIFMQIGQEKMRFLTGHAEAINCHKIRRVVSLTDIYGLAKQLTNQTVTLAEY